MKRDILDAGLFDSRIRQEEVGRKERILGYFLGPVSVVFLNSVLNNYLNVYYTDIIKLGSVWNGWFLTTFPIVVKILDALTILLMGVIVDRFYSRQGVARPWILFSAPLLAVSFALLFVFPTGNTGLMLVWIFISYNLFYSVAYTAYNTCHTLLVPLSTKNQEQRGRLSILTNAQGMMSGMLVKVTREEVANREPEIQRKIEAMRKAKEYGERKGVTVTMEDYDVFSSPIVFPEVLRRFFKEIPGLQCTFDTGNFVPCDRDVREEFAYYKDKIIAIHLKDRIENDNQGGVEKEPYITESGRKYYPAVVGCGDMHIPEIIAEMNKMGYKGPGIIELFGSTDIAVKMTASIRWMKENALNC